MVYIYIKNYSTRGKIICFVKGRVKGFLFPLLHIICPVWKSALEYSMDYIYEGKINLFDVTPNKEGKNKVQLAVCDRASECRMGVITQRHQIFKTHIVIAEAMTSDNSNFGASFLCPGRSRWVPLWYFITWKAGAISRGADGIIWHMSCRSLFSKSCA